MDKKDLGVLVLVGEVESLKEYKANGLRAVIIPLIESDGLYGIDSCRIAAKAARNWVYQAISKAFFEKLELKL